MTVGEIIGDIGTRTAEINCNLAEEIAGAETSHPADCIPGEQASV